MEFWLILAGVGAIGAATATYHVLKSRFKEPIPEEYYRQFQGVKGPLSDVSGKGKQIFKKVGQDVSIRCALFERREPHRIVMEARGKFVEEAGSLRRDGNVDVNFKGVSLKLELEQRQVTLVGAGGGSLGKLDLDSGVIEDRGHWNMERTLRGPDGSLYDPLELDGKNLYLCTYGTGKLFYSPLIAGECDELDEKQQHLVICLAALWNGVLNN